MNRKQSKAKALAQTCLLNNCNFSQVMQCSKDQYSIQGFLMER